MSEPNAKPTDESAVDDVRRVRQQFSREAAGDIRRHVEQTRAAYEKLQTELGLPPATTPAAASSPR